MRVRFFLSAMLWSVITPMAAHAATLNFTLSGVDMNPQGSWDTNTSLPGDPQYYDLTEYIESGTLSFSYAGTSSTIGLADLTNFNLVHTIDFIHSQTYPTAPQYNVYQDFGQTSPFIFLDTITQGLSGLTSFNATVDPNGVVTSLAFTTTPVAGSALPIYYAYLSNGMIATTSNGVISYNTTAPQDPFDYPNGLMTVGLISQVPEPASLGLLGVGALVCAARRRRN